MALKVKNLVVHTSIRAIEPETDVSEVPVLRPLNGLVKVGLTTRSDRFGPSTLGARQSNKARWEKECRGLVYTLPPERIQMEIPVVYDFRIGILTHNGSLIRKGVSPFYKILSDVYVGGVAKTI
jgi:hypothetical protein